MELLIVLVLLVLGFVFGQITEKRHYKRILSEEERLKDIMVFGARRPDPSIKIEQADLVTGSVVISVDYFKRFVAGLRTLIGGRLRGYETLLDRARREAIIRMKENARHKRASMIFNTKIETSSISKGQGRAVGTVEVVAYGQRSVKYSNPRIPEGINVGKRHPLADLLRLLVAVVAGLGLTVLVLALTVGWAAKFIPGEFEMELATRGEDRILSGLSEEGVEIKPGPEQLALQELADRLSAVMDLPDGMAITVDYADHDMVNAFATLGGRLIIFRGLIEKMPDENTLAMVMAHEIAHVRQRHVISSMGRGIAVALTVFGVTGASGSSVPDSLISGVGLGEQHDLLPESRARV